MIVEEKYLQNTDLHVTDHPPVSQGMEDQGGDEGQGQVLQNLEESGKVIGEIGKTKAQEDLIRKS